MGSVPEATAALENAMRALAGVAPHRLHVQEGEMAMASIAGGGSGS
jgi:hypothetical protein